MTAMIAAVRTLVCLAGAVVLAGCALADTRPERSPAVYLGAGMAGLNNPNRPVGDEDNLAVAFGARIPVGPVSLRPEAHWGDHSVLAAPSVTWDVRLLGEGPGAIDGHVGLGWTVLSEKRSNVLGNTSSPFLRVGAEGHLAGGLLSGASLLVAPFGYDHDDLAVAGVVYVGLRL